MKLKLKIGDIFTIPLGDHEVGFGQIINFPITKDVFIVVIFTHKQPKKISVNLSNICKSEILMLGYTTDAKLYHKHWIVVGNYIDNIKNIELPIHKIGIQDDVYIINYKGEKIRKVYKDVKNLDYMTTVAPVRYENALKAYFGLAPWIKEDFDKLLYAKTLEANIFYKTL
jgi:hypothetical protein